MAQDRGIHPATSWEYVAAAGETTLEKTSRGIFLAVAGILYAHIGADVAETKVGEYPAGTHVPIQTDKIGTSTTCTKMTVYHQDPGQPVN